MCRKEEWFPIFVDRTFSVASDYCTNAYEEEEGYDMMV
jgi:hypothetical protein